MKEQKKLTISMSIFTFIIFVAFGTIIVTEKTSPLFIPKIEKKLTEYLNKEYPEIKDELKIENTKYKNTIYTMKVTSKKNKNLSFNINYSNKKISDTYENDYLKGKTFLKHINKNIQKEIKQKTKKNYKTEINTNLNEFTTSISDKILKEENLSNLRIYTLEKNIYIQNFTPQILSSEIINSIKELESQEITPRTYTFIINDKDNKTLKITNFTYKTIENNQYNQIINDIINNNNTELLKKNRIKFKYTY